MSEEDAIVYIAEEYYRYDNNYHPLKTKSGNTLHKTYSQAESKLKIKHGDDKGKLRKGRILSYKLSFHDEILIKSEC